MSQNNSLKKLKLTFHGGVGTVTGANFLLESSDDEDGIRILVDCGMEQSSKFCEDCNFDTFPYDPASIHILFITHSHLDHIGKVPKLVREGFKGIIYSTPSTRAITEVMFEDSIDLIAREAKKIGKKPLYSREDVEDTMRLWQTVPYHVEKNVGHGFSFLFKDAGHILGSCMVEIQFNGKKIVFTGDLGNSPTPLLRDTEPVTDAKYIVMESVYGDRNHEKKKERTDRLRNIIQKTIERGGTLLIPAFSIERTQILLYELNNLIESGRIPSVPVYLDSPLAIAVTEIYKDKIQNFNDKVQKEIVSGDDIFAFPKLRFTKTTEASRAIAHTSGPKIIIAGSGMSHGGRIVNHEKLYLPDPNNTMLIVGFQAAGSLGRKIQDGASHVNIDGEKVSVRAHIETITGYSAHKDSDGLFQFVSSTADTLEKVFVTMGELKSALFLVQRLRDYLGIDAVAPGKGDSFELEF